LKEIKIYSSEGNQALENRKTISLTLEFKYTMSWSSCSIITEDKDGLLKDWWIGTYEEVSNLIKSLEIEDKYKKYYEKYAKDKLLFDPFGEVEKEIINNTENSVSNLNKNDIKNLSNKNINFLIKYKKLIISVLITIIGIIGGTKYIFNIKFADNVSKNNVFSENQTGGITAGGDVNVYQQKPDLGNFNISNLPSAFSFLNKVSQLDTTIEKENYIKTISGTEVADSGYINDISSGYNINTYFVFIKKRTGDSSFIVCTTDEKNEKFAILKKTSESLVQFKGKIKSGSVLNDCEFQ